MMRNRIPYLLVAITLLVVVVTLILAQDGESAPVASGKPRCAIKNPPSTPFLLKDTLIARFENTCLDPVAQIGSYACLLEYDHELSNPHILACHAFSRNLTLGRTEADIFVSVHCHYTTVPRYYAIDGYGWAVALEGKFYKSPDVRSRAVPIFKQAAHGLPAQGYCHVSAKDLLEGWRGR